MRGSEERHLLFVFQAYKMRVGVILVSLVANDEEPPGLCKDEYCVRVNVGR